MRNLKIATAQFENRSGDKEYNLSVIDRLSKKAAEEGADAIAFHECSITGYSFARKLSREQMLDLAELIPEGTSIQCLQSIAERNQIILLAGIFEKDKHNDMYKAYVCVDKTGLLAKHRKLHPFVNKNIKPGNEYTVFDICGWRCGILLCYDNNIVENVRATKLLGADILFMPHVTMCTPSTRPGAGFVNPALWENRAADPTSLRLEFDGLKGRAWLMKWLPSRAYDNALYAVFSNPIGMDDDQLKNGCSMILDPYGDILAECRNFSDEYVLATITEDKLTKAGGFRYLRARRPELYKDIIGKSHLPDQRVSWMQA
jgi:predicted amidohydrolase